MLTREYTSAGHVNRITLTKKPAGWEIREERDDTVVKRANYRDWHRVERAIQVFELKTSGLVLQEP
ncbi:MAG TPA: hypothetical protein VES67_09425 [Vicinamibacterales bacterium]|nr:hypothetical protein [Vicinamibacterales bacterium]